MVMLIMGRQLISSSFQWFHWSRKWQTECHLTAWELVPCPSTPLRLWPLSFVPWAEGSFTVTRGKIPFRSYYMTWCALKTRHSWGKQCSSNSKCVTWSFACFVIDAKSWVKSVFTATGLALMRCLCFEANWLYLCQCNFLSVSGFPL